MNKVIGVDQDGEATGYAGRVGRCVPVGARGAQGGVAIAVARPGRHARLTAIEPRDRSWLQFCKVETTVELDEFEPGGIGADVAQGEWQRSGLAEIERDGEGIVRRLQPAGW